MAFLGKDVVSCGQAHENLLGSGAPLAISSRIRGKGQDVRTVYRA